MNKVSGLTSKSTVGKLTKKIETQTAKNFVPFERFQWTSVLWLVEASVKNITSANIERTLETKGSQEE